MNVSLPKSLRDWVDQLVVEHDYGTASEYIRELVREDRKVKLKAALEARLLASIQAGGSRELTPKAWADLRARGRAESARRRRHVA